MMTVQKIRAIRARRVIKSLPMPLELAEAVEAAADRRRMSVSAYCREAIERAVRRDLRKLAGEPLSDAA